MCRSKIGKAPLATLALALTATLVSGCAIGFRGPAPDVSDKTAFIQGDVLSNRTESGEAWFKYGTTSAYGQETAARHGRVRGRRRAGLLRAPVRARPSHDLPLRPLRRRPGPGVRRLLQRRPDLHDASATTSAGALGAASTAASSRSTSTTSRAATTARTPGGPSVSRRASIPHPVACLRMDADQKFTVGLEQAPGGAGYSLIFVDLSPGAELGGERARRRTPPDPLPGDPARHAEVPGRARHRLRDPRRRARRATCRARRAPPRAQARRRRAHRRARHAARPVSPR